MRKRQGQRKEKNGGKGKDEKEKIEGKLGTEERGRMQEWEKIKERRKDEGKEEGGRKGGKD